MSLLSLVCGCVLLWSGACGQAAIRNKYVSTNLDAKWDQTSLTHEVSEYLADENPQYFWTFVEDTCSAQLDTGWTEERRYQQLLTLAGQQLSSQQLRLLRFSLSLRLHSPRVALAQQLATSHLNTPSCEAFVQLGGRLVCAGGELSVALLAAQQQQAEDTAAPQVYAEDHHYRDDAPAGAPVAVLYGQMGTEQMCALHAHIKPLADAGKVDYLLRHYVKVAPDSKVRLSGYGVELAIKSTEYKAQDDTQVTGDGEEGDAAGHEVRDEVEGFVFSRLRELHPELSANLTVFQRHLSADTADLSPLKVWQLQELSLQAAQRIADAAPEEAVKLMTSLAQNFPTVARSLIRTKVASTLKDELKHNYQLLYQSLNVDHPDAALLVNGLLFDMETSDVFTLFEHVRQEQRIMDGLHRLGVPQWVFDELLRVEVTGGGEEASFAVDFRDTAVTWLNDVEHDKQYARWPASITELLRPTYPGMLRTVRKNMYHLVFIMDPSRRSSLALLKLVQSLFTSQMPFTFGLVLAVTSDADVTGQQDAGVAMSEAFNYVMQEEKTKPAMKALNLLIDAHSAAAGSADVSVADVERTLRRLYPSADVDDVLGETSAYDAGRQLAREYISRLGLADPPQVLFNGAPLPMRSLSENALEEVLLQELMRALHQFTKAVYRQEIEDGDDIVEWIVSQPNFMPRLNDRVLKSDKRWLDMSGEAAPITSTEQFRALSARHMSASLGALLNYAARPAPAARLRPITIWIVADLESADGRQLLHDALQLSKGSRDVRVAFVPNPVSPSGGADNDQNRRALAALETLTGDTLLKYLLAQTAGQQQQQASDALLTTVDRERLEASMSSLPAWALSAPGVFCGRVLRAPAGGRAIVVNGQLVGPLHDGETFGEHDFALLEKFAARGQAELETKLLRAIPGEGDLSDVMMKAFALLSSRTLKMQRWTVPKLRDKHSVVHLAARDPTRPAFDLVAICDPVSRGAQRLGPLLTVLSDVLNADVRLVLNPQLKHSDMPLKSFYRLVLEPEPVFSSSGELVGPSARFTGMPGSPILTQHYHVPDNWMVEAVNSPYDLDNIKLDDVEHGVHSEFELEHLLLEGHCFEQGSGNPPRGLQVTLGSARRPVIVDTIVMANLGYFQLKALPGAWTLRLRQGRSADLYSLVSMDDNEIVDSDAGASAVISSFRSHVVKLRVAKKPDMQSQDLLSDQPDDTAGIWGSIKSTFGGGAAPAAADDDTLNIFSLASGHLYERLMRIMMLAVLRHTQTPVKFWFLKNYLSPTFKDLLPHMARQYGFQFELVQYKWPRWLHQQTDKQRIIWGYKILFLDVLFPLDVKKIIFVDADQIVRADLRELRDLDLEGAPYGYTPFCDSRKEMDGFRFWNQGYWRSHLQGRKYHISALYVVDLKKFRQIAAGDRLRGQYQGLSQDPNSLSNLDQDLPNNMIHQVRIRSLPQEWLWCETWCDDQSKQYAKTIDLCNNPLTKEPKLEAAVRIAPEWTGYDTEIREFQEALRAGTLPNASATESASSNRQPEAAAEHKHGEL